MDHGSASGEAADKKDDDFSSKAQIMTLMTTDVDRVSEFAWHLFSLVGAYGAVFVNGVRSYHVADSPIEIAIGSLFLYKLLGTDFVYLVKQWPNVEPDRRVMFLRFSCHVSIPSYESLRWNYCRW